MGFNPFFFIFVSALANAFSNVLLKITLARMPQAHSVWAMAGSLIKSPFFWIGGGLFLFALFSYTMALQRINLSIAYPLLVSSVALIIITTSLLFLHETLTLAKVSGVFLLLGGIWLLAR